MTKTVGVQFRGTGKIYSFDPGELTPDVGTAVIVETAHGIEYGVVASPVHDEPDENIVTQLRPVVRIATADDTRRVEDNARREAEALRICSGKIEEHKLDMKLVDAEAAFDGSKLLFSFTSDNRVDFRELVKDLAGTFHTRIELRQIGVRDEARTLGGLGICGRPFCCSSFLSEFQPVSIKMAKEQGLSLNPTKISGTCGRLMCCLKYEQEAYEDLIKSTPPIGSYVHTPDGNGTVTECQLVAGILKIRLDAVDEGTVKSYKVGDVTLLKRPERGKQKKQPESAEAKSEKAPTDSPATETLPPQEERREAATIIINDMLLGEAPAPKPAQSAPRQNGENGGKNNDKNRRRNNRFRHNNKNGGDKQNSQPAKTGEK